MKTIDILRPVTKAGVARLKESYKNHGIWRGLPIYVRRVREPQDSFNQDVSEEYEVIEGAHRVTALLELHLTEPYDAVIFKVMNSPQNHNFSVVCTCTPSSPAKL
jgi:ParB-like nuclease domain